MKILVLEDKAIGDDIVEYFSDKGHEVSNSNNIARANAFINNGDFDIIIVDLNIPPVGLETEEIKEYIGNGIYGWAWLKRIFKSNPAYKGKTIILSGYIDVLKKIVPKDLKGISLYSKRYIDDEYDYLDTLLQIAEKKHNGNK